MRCRGCKGESVIKSGLSRSGKQRYECRGCGSRFVEEPGGVNYTSEFKNTVLKAMNERMGLRAAQRVFGVHRNTILNWMNQRRNLYGQLQNRQNQNLKLMNYGHLLVIRTTKYGCGWYQKDQLGKQLALSSVIDLLLHGFALLDQWIESIDPQ